ncbi:MAG: hypothetical protein U0350_08600 [Caldilineaceae bacterium]
MAEYADEDEDYDYDPERMRARQAQRLAEAPQRLGVSPATIEKISACHYDRIIEKHEGPEDWAGTLQFYDLDMFEVEGYRVLFPLDRRHHKNITILRCIVSQNQQMLTIFLKDTTHVEDPDEEMFWGGFLAICEKFPDEDFYLTTLYHEWFIVDNRATLGE